MKIFSILIIASILSTSCSGQKNNDYSMMMNKCGSGKIYIYKNPADNYRHSNYRLYFRSGINDTVTIESNNKIQTKFVDTNLTSERAMDFVSFESKKDSLVKISIGKEKYCFTADPFFFNYDLIKRDHDLYIYLDKMRNRSFE